MKTAPDLQTDKCTGKFRSSESLLIAIDCNHDFLALLKKMTWLFISW